MSLLDIFRVGRIKREAQNTQRELEAANKKLGDAAIMTAAEALKAVEKAKIEFLEIENKRDAARGDFLNLQQKIAELKDQIVQLDDQILLQEFGLFTPKYNLGNCSTPSVTGSVG